jgi:hypothetical protein
MRTLASMDWIELSGYAASFLVFPTFCMKTMIPLRLVAIVSNALHGVRDRRRPLSHPQVATGAGPSRAPEGRCG